MLLRSVRDVGDLSGKNVLVRADFNVGLNADGHAAEHFKLNIAKETIDFLFSRGVRRVALLSHFGRPDGKIDPRFSLSVLANDIAAAIGRPVRFVSDCAGEDVSFALANPLVGEEVLLLENVRFYEEEERNDDSFAERLAAPFDVFVNEAFSVCHRAHSSVLVITDHLPSFAGLRLLEETAHLNRVRLQPKHPAIAVIGGAKIETKLPIIRTFEKLYDAVLVGGMIANEAIDQKIVFSDKVCLPVDFSGGKERLDIGPRTIESFSESLRLAETIVWNGPMGKFEEETYAAGTRSLVRAISENRKAYIVIGGGESLTLVEQEGMLDRMGFVSAGGGAMLDFLGGMPMPGLDALTV